MSKAEAETLTERVSKLVRANPVMDIGDISSELGIGEKEVRNLLEEIPDRLKVMKKTRLKRNPRNLTSVERDVMWLIGRYNNLNGTTIENAYCEEAGMELEGYSSIPEVWRSCVDSAWEARNAYGGDISDLIDGEKVSDGVYEANRILSNTHRNEFTEKQKNLLKAMVRKPTASNKDLCREAGYSTTSGGSHGQHILCREGLKRKDESRREAAAEILRERGHEVPDPKK